MLTNIQIPEKKKKQLREIDPQTVPGPSMGLHCLSLLEPVNQRQNPVSIYPSIAGSRGEQQVTHKNLLPSPEPAPRNHKPAADIGWKDTDCMGK